MSEIYNKAAPVHAWLGEHSVDSEIPFQYAEEFRYKPVPVDFRRDGSWRTNVFGPAFAKIFLRPYFRRLWIVQELILAKEIFLVAGNDTMELDCFMEAADSWSMRSWSQGGKLMTDGIRTLEKVIRDRTGSGPAAAAA